MGMDRGAITSPQLNADVDYAAKRYAARAVGELLTENPGITADELHQELIGRAEKAREASSFGRWRLEIPVGSLLQGLAMPAAS